MNREIEPKPGELYKHFKDKLYQIITVASHSETNEKMVVYQALYGDFKTYVRPLTMFMSKVDKEKYPLVKAEYRFEKIVLRDEINSKEKENNTSLNESINQDESNNLESSLELDKALKLDERIIVEESIKLNDLDQNQVNPILLEFLDARTYQEKLSIVMGNKNNMTDRLINAMAASLDCTVEEGNIDDRLSGFIFCLQTFSRFENNRLR